MRKLLPPPVLIEPDYPDSDGEPMADNTLQAWWMMLIYQNLAILFRDDPEVFLAFNLLWYPVRSHPEIRAAPDVFCVRGRPRGHRGSYKQWEEGNLPPQVVFEILSPGNSKAEMAEKLAFYERYGVEEYYLYDPETDDLSGWRRVRGRLRALRTVNGWCSPRLGITFDQSGAELVIRNPDGRPFRSMEEIAASEAQAQKSTRREQRLRQQTEREKEAAEKRAEALAQRLRDLGVDPDAPAG